MWNVWIFSLSRADAPLPPLLQNKQPLRVLFLSADTGGGHRASAEALAKQVRPTVQASC